MAGGQKREYRYRAPILDALARHGISPTRSTPPAVARDLLNDLYRYEIRRLRERLRRGEVARSGYAEAVRALRDKYALLSIPLAQWTDERAEP